MLWLEPLTYVRCYRSNRSKASWFATRRSFEQTVSLSFTCKIGMRTRRRRLIIYAKNSMPGKILEKPSFYEDIVVLFIDLNSRNNSWIPLLRRVAKASYFYKKDHLCYRVPNNSCWCTVVEDTLNRWRTETRIFFHTMFL